MNALSWAAIAEQLRALGVDVPATGAKGSDYPPARPVPHFQPDAAAGAVPGRCSSLNNGHHGGCQKGGRDLHGACFRRRTYR